MFWLSNSLLMTSKTKVNLVSSQRGILHESPILKYTDKGLDKLV